MRSGCDEFSSQGMFIMEKDYWRREKVIFHVMVGRIMYEDYI